MQLRLLSQITLFRMRALNIQVFVKLHVREKIIDLKGLMLNHAISLRVKEVSG